MTEAHATNPEHPLIPPDSTGDDHNTLPPADTFRPHLLRCLWHAAKTGFRYTSYVIGPLAAIPLLLGFALTAFGLGSGRGWGMHRMVLSAIGIYLGLGLLGSFFGAVLGLMVAVFRRLLLRLSPAAACSIDGPSIRLFSRGARRAAPSDSAPPRRRLWPWLVGVPLLLVLAVAFGTGIYLGRKVDRRLAAAIAVADRDDPFWRLDDLLAHRERVPDAENATFVVTEAASRLPDNWPDGPTSPPGRPNLPTARARLLYDLAGRTADNERLDDAVDDGLRFELEAHDEALGIARTLADHPPGSHRLIIGPAVLDTRLPQTWDARSVARLLVADAAVRAHAGDLEAALVSCRALLGAARSIGDDPFLLSQAVRIGIGRIALRSARRVLAQGEPSDAALARLQALVLDEQDQPLLLHSLKGERALMTELIRRIAVGDVAVTRLSDHAALPGASYAPLSVEMCQSFIAFTGDGFQSSGVNGRGSIAPWGKLILDNQRAIELEWLNDAVAIARQPAATWSSRWTAWGANVDKNRRRWYWPFTATLPVLLSHALSSAFTGHVSYRCDLGATALLLAAERHRLKTGAWPESIAVMDPDILPSAPVDPFTGHAYRMERRDGQFLIYSVGPNRKDEHGAFDRKQWQNGGADDISAGAWDVPLRRQPSSPSHVPDLAREFGSLP